MKGFELGVTSAPKPRLIEVKASNDWFEVRLDGVLIAEDHRVTVGTIEQLAKHLGFAFELRED
jgi:hypothetical protein